MVDAITPLDRRILLKHIGGFSDADLIITPNPVLDTRQQALLDTYTQRRLAGEPIAKILGVKEFYSLDFTVNQHVLDPRPDSEVLVDCVLAHIQDQTAPRLLELGCGSGCLSVAIASNHDNAVIDAVDISADALAVAQQNVARHGMSERVRCFQSNWYSHVDESYDVIFANPPYIESRIIESLDVDVKNYDPILALDGGSDGLDPYHIIFSQAKNVLYPQGALYVEHGANQEGKLQRLMECHGFAMIRCFKDLSGTNRVLSASLCMNQKP